MVQTRRKSPAKLSVGLCLLLALGTAAAAGAYRVGNVRPDKGYVSLDDRIFLLDTATRVYRANGSPATITELKKGMSVTIRVQGAPGSSKPVLAEIRIVR